MPSCGTTRGAGRSSSRASTKRAATAAGGSRSTARSPRCHGSTRCYPTARSRVINSSPANVCDPEARIFTLVKQNAEALSGVRPVPTVSLGGTDDLGYFITENPVTVHDLQATMLHLLGMDHKKLTYFHNGRRYRLTDVAGEVIQKILA